MFLNQQRASKHHEFQKEFLAHHFEIWFAGCGDWLLGA